MARGPTWAFLTTAAKPTIDSASWNALRAAAGGGPLYAALPTPTKTFLDQAAWDAVVTSVPDTYEGSDNLTFGAIPDGGVEELTFVVTGATVGRPVAAIWPLTLDPKLVGMMYVSDADEITVRLVNMSGASVTLGALAFGAMVL